jgi:hypothetical protein
VVRQAKLRRYVSSEHFSVDGTLLEAWASHKSFKPKDGPGGPPAPAGRNVEVDFHGQTRSNQTHRSTTDPEALLARKSAGTPARLCYAGHLLMENRNALIVDAELTQADGYAERTTAIELLARLPRRARRRTVAADKGYDTRAFVADCRQLGVTPHVAPHTNGRRSAIDGRTTRHRAPDQSTDPAEDRRGLRLDQDHRRRSQAPPQGATTQPGLVPPHRRHLQPAPDHRPRRQHRITTTRRGSERHAGAREPTTRHPASSPPPLAENAQPFKQPFFRTLPGSDDGRPLAKAATHDTTGCFIAVGQEAVVAGRGPSELSTWSCVRVA